MEAAATSTATEDAPQYCSIAEAMRLITHPFDGDKRKLREFTENVDVVFELVDPSKHDVLLKFVKAKITGDARSKLMVRDLTHSWELVKAILEENYATRRTLDYYACKMFSARQGKSESIASWGNQIDELQSDLREAARRVCKPREIQGAIGLINHLGKACFIQGLANERIQTIVRSRGESILLSEAIELSLEEECAILSSKERSAPTANGPPLRCSNCNKLGHAASKCMELTKFPPRKVRSVLSCFNCGREGHVAKFCRRRPLRNAGVGRDADDFSRAQASVGRGTDDIGTAVRASRNNAGVSRDTDDFSRAQGNGWVRSGNDRRALASNPSTARRLK